MSGIIDWADDVLKRFPASTTDKNQDEWYGVENLVDVLEIARGVKKLQAENEHFKALCHRESSVIKQALKHKNNKSMLKVIADSLAEAAKGYKRK